MVENRLLDSLMKRYKKKEFIGVESANISIIMISKNNSVFFEEVIKFWVKHITCLTCT